MKDHEALKDPFILKGYDFYPAHYINGKFINHLTLYNIKEEAAQELRKSIKNHILQVFNNCSGGCIYCMCPNCYRWYLHLKKKGVVLNSQFEIATNNKEYLLHMKKLNESLKTP